MQLFKPTLCTLEMELNQISLWIFRGVVILSHIARFSKALNCGLSDAELSFAEFEKKTWSFSFSASMR